MARRKQAQPRHWENSQELADNLQNGIPSSEADSSDDEHVCGKCRAEFATLADFLQHKQQCVSKRPVLLTLPKEDGNEGSSRPPPPRAAKNFSDHPRLEGENDDIDGLHRLKSDSRIFSTSGFFAGHLPNTNVVIEELRNTTVAVAQRGQDSHLEDMIALQKAVYSIQQQQMFNFQAIQAIQAYILGTPTSSTKTVPLLGTAALTPPQSSDGAVGSMVAPNGSQPSAPTSARTSVSSKTESGRNGGPPREPNTLELLEKHTERALQNTMGGGSFLLNGFGNKSDGARLKKSKDGKVDGALKHGCRFCGKVFGSDSGLQIHIRSHTGERPFKCSVCGSCFSTRGNLKVHFQRHADEHANPRQNDREDHYNAANGRDFPEGASQEPEQQTKPPPYDQALDFSTSVQNSSKTNEAAYTRPSRSPSLNDMSNLTEDSQDYSVENNRLDFCGEPNDDDDEDDDEDSSVMDDNMVENGEMSLAYRQTSVVNAQSSSFTPSPSFSSFFRPVSFNGSLSENPSCLPPASEEAAKSDGFSITADPTFYQDLLPRIGSNDNSWENLMEVTKTSETYKLQQLVDNIETKVSDPNQCIVCNRVLSCKSALQMHYRTHTGERPFKCKICSRAFTTKGNLKTHMGVHRLKRPVRIMHQCPVCHKQFSNALILQQHVRMHTGEANPDALYTSEDKPPTMLPPAFPRLMPPPSLEPLALTYPTAAKAPQDQTTASVSETVIKKTSTEMVAPQSVFLSSPSASITSSDAPTPQPEEMGTDHKTRALGDDQPNSEIMSDEKSFASERSSPANVTTDSPSPSVKEGSPKILDSPVREQALTVLNLSPKAAQVDKLVVTNKENFGQAADEDDEDKKVKEVAFAASKDNRAEKSLICVSASRTLAPAPVCQSDRKSLPFGLPYSERPLPPTSASDFTPSLAALENQVNGIKINQPLPFPNPFGIGISVGNYLRHEAGPTLSKRERSSSYSSPSKNNNNNNSEGSADERSPSSVTQRESPSSGYQMLRQSENVVALDLTPNASAGGQRAGITDLTMFSPLAGMPFSQTSQRMCTTCRVCYKTFACQSALEIHYRSHTKERPFKCDVCDRGFSTKGNMKQHMLTHKIRDLPSQLFTQVPTSCATAITSPPIPIESKPQVLNRSSPKRSPEDLSNKRPLIDAVSGQPIPKRPPGLPKHLCHVCNKPFSSGSALQIHMRTHTGDKPFQCTVCTRAFTTKGNLKVHMGTHMWNNCTSRRGRRMSLDLAAPLSLPGPKPADFPAPRHDLYFPYLPAFMNGMTPPHVPQKMNEISVIQSAGIHNGNPISTMASAMMPPLSLVTSSRLTQTTTLSKTPHDSSSAMEPSKEEPLQNEKSPLKMKGRNSPAVSMGWQWKIACSVCNKICVSSTELELHMKTAHSQQQPDLAECPADSDKPST